MVQVIEQTREEKIKTYMRMPRKRLAEMLYNCNEALAATSGNSQSTPYAHYQTGTGRNGQEFQYCDCLGKL